MRFSLLSNSGRLLSALVIFASESAFAQNAMTGWNFKFTNFVIGAWASPSNSDAQVAAYSQAGFNTIMVGRFMSGADYSHPADVESQMDLALKYGLGAIIDGFTLDSNPWGGQDYDTNLSNGDTPPQHPISFDEFKWLQADLGTHPALVGYFLRDDVAGVNEEYYANVGGPVSYHSERVLKMVISC